MRFIVVLCSLLVLSGCTSMPLATMLKFSQFDEQTIAQLDPQQMLVKVSVRDDYSLIQDSTKLQMKFQPDDVNESTKAALNLKLLSKVAETRSAGLFSSDTSVITYEFAVDQAGVETIRQMQAQFTKADHKGTMNFKVNTDFEPIDAKNMKDELLLWIDLRLSEKEGYFPLIEAAHIELEQS